MWQLFDLWKPESFHDRRCIGVECLGESDEGEVSEMLPGEKHEFLAAKVVNSPVIELCITVSKLPDLIVPYVHSDTGIGQTSLKKIGER